MKKILSLALLLALMLSLSCARAIPQDYQGEILPDFTVETLSGDSFTLSESLKTHDLVLVNFWATWCGPCCMEFPYLEEAWEKYGDRVDVIALNVWDEQTNDSLLKQFVKEYGLQFNVARDKNGILDSMNPEGIPTSLIVDKNMRIVAVEVGAKFSVEEFAELFDSLLPAAAEEDGRRQPGEQGGGFASGGRIARHTVGDRGVRPAEKGKRKR